ncbi:MAG: PIN domain-containing protein [Chloroflexota bacterium]
MVKILDSDHCIALLRGQLRLTDWVSPLEELAITTISVGELIHGAYKSAQSARNLARVDVLLATVTVLPFDQAAARRFGLLKASLEQAGHRLSDLDLQIAGIALDHNAPLATHNQHHFERIAGLVIEDWLV